MTDTALKKARLKLDEYRDMGIKISVENNLILKAKKHPTSLKKAIGAFCFYCFGGTETETPDPGWKNMIRTCTSPNCPLYEHRPYR